MVWHTCRAAGQEQPHPGTTHVVHCSACTVLLQWGPSWDSRLSTLEEMALCGLTLTPKLSHRECMPMHAYVHALNNKGMPLEGASKVLCTSLALHCCGSSDSQLQIILHLQVQGCGAHYLFMVHLPHHRRNRISILLQLFTVS